jgi:hypothetical protein
MGLVVTTGRIGATTARLALFPARVVARSPFAGPFRSRAEGLAETGRSAEPAARRRLETMAEEVLATPEAEQVADGVLGGQLPEALARSLIEHRVVERVVAEALASAELEGEAVLVRETERTEQLVAQVLASPTLERLLADALESRLTLDLTDKMVRSPAFRSALTQILSSPELRAALKGQSMSLAEEMAAGLRRRLFRLDDAVERGPRRWFRKPPRSQVAPGGGGQPPVRYGGIATRGLALAVDAALATMIFLTGTAVPGLVVSLVWNPGRPRWSGRSLASRGARRGRLLRGVLSTAGQTLQDADDAPARRRWFLFRTGSRRSLRLLGLGLAILLLLTGFLPVLVDDRRRACRTPGRHRRRPRRGFACRRRRPTDAPRTAGFGPGGAAIRRLKVVGSARARGGFDIALVRSCASFNGSSSPSRAQAGTTSGRRAHPRSG